MTLGDKFGLFCRTVLVPAARTIWTARDHTRYDAARTLRTVLYICPKDLPASEFRAIFAAATGKPIPSRVNGVLLQLAILGTVLFLLARGFWASAWWVIAVWVGTASLVVTAQIIYYSTSSTPIPFNTDPDRVLNAWLQAGRCPACGYTLAPTHRCNECGAVWQQLPPIDRRG